MRRVTFNRNRPEIKGSRRQRGQALIYGLFVLTGGLAALFFLFNTGQLSAEKTKLVNTADAVAYSAGVMHARTLNFEAYTNRAMVANTAAIAQLVSLSSWVQYVDNLAKYGTTVADSSKYPGFSLAYYTARSIGSTTKQNLIDRGVLKDLAEGSDKIIQVLMGAQTVAYAGLIPARLKVMDEVAQANYGNGKDGKVVVDEIPLTINEFTSFISQYSKDERTRFADVVKTVVNKDNFVKKRSWDMPGRRSDCAGAWASGRPDFLDRRGGTELLGFDEWKAMDTLSEKRWVPSNKTDVWCLAISEVPEGWGLQSAADNPSTDLDLTHYDYSLPTNPAASGLAIVTSSSSWGYSGLPSFYDLSQDVLKKDDPRLKFAIRVRRDKSETATSEGRSAIKKTTPRPNGAPGLNDYQAKPAVGPGGKNEFVAVSASEVFFARPGDLANQGSSAYNVAYGKQDLGKPNEMGSLFNPYWQVHLIYSEVDVKKAQAMQDGVVLP